ncbi:TPA: hypothetical protein DCX15_04165 [bacterium]|nr:hypothetical protein [bacterium]
MSKYYGREDEIQLLRDEFKKRGSSLIVYGPPGVGKTALLREFYEELLRKKDAVVSYTRVYSSIEPFSHLFTYQLISLSNSVKQKGEFRDLVLSLRDYLQNKMRREIMRSLLLRVRGYLITQGFHEVARSLEGFWDGEVFELGCDLLSVLKMGEIISLIKAFEAVLHDRQIVLILDDFGCIIEERPDIFEGMLTYLPERSHLYFVLNNDDFNHLDSEIKEKATTLPLTWLDKEVVNNWIREEAATLLREHGLDEIYQVTQGNPFLISEWIRQEGVKEIPEDRGLGFIEKTLNGYDLNKKCYLVKIALTRMPFSISKCTKLFRIDEEATRRYLLEFENDGLIARVYLEGENIFYLDHQLKQERILSILTKEFDLCQIYKELATYFEEEISYPAEEDVSYFWITLRETLHYYGLIKDAQAKEACNFYNRLITILEDPNPSCQSLEDLLLHPHLKGLKIRLRIIATALLARRRMDKLVLFKKSLNELNRFVLKSKSVRSHLIEYAKALFYLISYASREQAKGIIDVLIETNLALIHRNPDVTELKVIFAHTLYNLVHDLSCFQEFDEAGSIIGVLASLTKETPNLLQIKVEYARTLANLSSKLGEVGKFDDLFKYLERLGLLVESDSEEDIQVEYAKALTNTSLYLAKGRRLDQLDNILTRLKDLAERSGNLLDVKVEYARALANASLGLSENERFDDSSSLIEALATLTVRGGILPEVVNIYTSSLFNLSSELGKSRRFEAITDILTRMRQLILEEPTNDELALAYARTLYNLCYDLGKAGRLDELIENFTLLKEFFRRNPQSEIELIYFKTIFNAITDLAKTRRVGRISRFLLALEELGEEEFKNTQSLQICGDALFNLSSSLGENRQFEGMKKALNILENLKDRDSRIKESYLNALINASVSVGKGKDFEELAKIVEKAEQLAIGEEDMKLAYIKILVNASGYLGREGRFDEMNIIVEKGERLFEKIPYDGQVKTAYLDILVNASASLGKKGDLSDLRKIVNRLGEMNDTSPGDGAVSIAYTKALVSLGDELERRGEMVELNKIMSILETISKGSPQVSAFLETIDFPMF